jgi:hypothetical protein
MSKIGRQNEKQCEKNVTEGSNKSSNEVAAKGGNRKWKKNLMKSELISEAVLTYSRMK